MHSSGGCSRKSSNLPVSMNGPVLDDGPSGLLHGIVQPVADVVAGRVVVTAVHLFEAGPVQMNRDRRLAVRVTDPVDAPVAGEHRGGAVLGAPGEVPRLFESGVLEPGPII